MLLLNTKCGLCGNTASSGKKKIYDAVPRGGVRHRASLQNFRQTLPNGAFLCLVRCLFQQFLQCRFANTQFLCKFAPQSEKDGKTYIARSRTITTVHATSKTSIDGAVPYGCRFFRIYLWFVVNRAAYGESLRFFCCIVINYKNTTFTLTTFGDL